MELSEIRVDPALVEHGGWVSDIPGFSDVELHVRPFDNPKFDRLQSQMRRALPRSKRTGGQIDEEEDYRIESTCLLKTVLLGWRNVKEKGVDIPFSDEQASKFMLDPQYRAFRNAVRFASLVVSDNKIADEEDAAKN